MITALAKLPQEEFTNHLLTMMQGQSQEAGLSVYTPGLAEDLKAIAEEDFFDVRASLARIQGMGQQGMFVHKDTEQRFQTLEGIVIGKLNSQALYPPGDHDQTEWAQGERAYWGAVKYLCRAGSVRRPPEINPDLSPAQREEVMRRRAGAPTCEKCPLAKPQPDGKGGWQAPDCKGYYDLLWWDAALQDYVWVRVGGTSVPSLRKAFNDLARKGLPLQFAARLSYKAGEKKGSAVYCTAQIEFAPTKLDDRVVEVAVQKHKALMPLFTEKVHQENDGEYHEQAPIPADQLNQAAPASSPGPDSAGPAPVSAPPPATRGLRLGPDGQPILACERPVAYEDVPPPNDDDAPEPRLFSGGSRMALLGDDNF